MLHMILEQEGARRGERGARRGGEAGASDWTNGAWLRSSGKTKGRDKNVPACLYGCNGMVWAGSWSSYQTELQQQHIKKERGGFRLGQGQEVGSNKVQV